MSGWPPALFRWQDTYGSEGDHVECGSRAALLNCTICPCKAECPCSLHRVSFKALLGQLELIWSRDTCETDKAGSTRIGWVDSLVLTQLSSQSPLVHCEGTEELLVLMGKTVPQFSSLPGEERQLHQAMTEMTWPQVSE